MQRETSEKPKELKSTPRSIWPLCEEKEERKTTSLPFKFCMQTGGRPCRTSWWLGLWGLYSVWVEEEVGAPEKEN